MRSYVGNRQEKTVAISLYEGRKYDPSRFMKSATVLNIAVALVAVFAWHATGWLIAEPISAATTSTVSETGKPGLLEYPYVLLWAMPVFATLAGWSAYKSGYKTFGRFVAVYPTLLFAMSWTWYHYYYWT